MIRLRMPPYDVEQVLIVCLENSAARNRNHYLSGASDLADAARQYESFGSVGDLYQIVPLGNNYQNQPVCGGLRKDELIKLYEYYLLKKNTNARKIYDQLLASSGKRCPFCCGISESSNLDHYLPKSFFPQYSILPLNLIPSCRDCNMGRKAAECSTKKVDQVLHPILDSACFFNEQWIFAQYNVGSPGFFRFYVDPPVGWADSDKERARFHFDQFDLPRRYSVLAAEELVNVDLQLQNYLNKAQHGTVDDFKEFFLQPVVDGTSCLNQWKRVMYMALISGL